MAFDVLLDRCRADLARARADRAVWAGLAYEPGLDGEGLSMDLNEAARARVLWALQHDGGPGDRELVRFLFAAEIRCHEEAPFQGNGPELLLAGMLVAEYRDVADAPAQWAAKTANFDTWCGYPIELVLAAGCAATVDAFRALLPDQDAAAALERLLTEDGGQPCADDELVARALAYTRRHHPADPAAVHPATWEYRVERHVG